MTKVLYTNNAVAALAAPVAVSDVTITVTGGSVYPAPTGTDYFFLTIDGGADVEIVKVTSRVGNLLNVVRAQQGTAAKAFPAGTQTALRVTAAGFEAIYTDLAGKANFTHTHAIADVTGLQSTLDGKALLSHTHAIADVTGLQTALDGKAALSHTHIIADVTGLQTALDGKAALSHTHTLSQISDMSAFARALNDDADAATARGTLGLGTAAVVNTGTSGGTVPLLNTAVTFSQNFSVSDGAGRVQMRPTGDIQAYRTGGTTGYLFLNSAETRYFGFDGTDYALNVAALSVTSVKTNRITGTLSSCYVDLDNFGLGSGIPGINFDGNDYFYYHRANNTYNFGIAASTCLQVTSTGMKVPIGKTVEWLGAGGPAVLEESYGIRYTGGATHPFQISTAASLLVGINAGGANYGAGKIYAASDVIIAAGGRFYGHSTGTGTIAASASGSGCFEVQGAGGSAAAYMQFHRPGAYAIHFGLDQDNQFAIGSWSYGATRNRVLIEGGSYTMGTMTFTSDERAKVEIEPYEGGIELIRQMQPISYLDKTPAKPRPGWEQGGRKLGLSAQAQQKIAPMLVTVDREHPEIKDCLSLDYARHVVPLINAVKYLDRENTELKSEVTELKALVRALLENK